MLVGLMPITALASDITVTINGQPVSFAGQGPVMVGGRTMVPVRGVFETLGFVVDWDIPTRTATLTSVDYTVIISVGNYTFTTNGVSHTLDVPAQLIGGSTMLPIAAVLRSVGYEVDWNGTTRTVVITSPVPTPMPAPPIEEPIVEEPTAEELAYSQIRAILGVDYTILPREYTLAWGGGTIRWQFLELKEPLNLANFPSNINFHSPANSQRGDVYIMTFPEGHSNVHINVGPNEHDIYWFNVTDAVLEPQETVDIAELQVQERLAEFNMARQYTSENFYWYSNNENARWLPYMATELESRVFAIFEAFGIDGFHDRKTILYFSNQDLTKWVSRYFQGMWVGYEFTNYMGFGGERMYLTRPPRSTRPSDNMIRLLIHEAVHLVQYFIVDGDVYAVPTWLMEGAAVYFEGRSGNHFEGIIRMSIRDGNIWTLSYLEDIDWDSDSFAWDVWGAATVQFIHETFGFEYVVELHRNYDIESVFGISRAEFERQWHQYLRENFR